MKNQKYYISILLCSVLVLTTPLIGLSQSNEEAQEQNTNEPTQEQNGNEQPYPTYPSYSPKQEQKANEPIMDKVYRDAIQKEIELNNEINKARSERNTGIFMFIAGAIASVVSIPFIPYSETKYNKQTNKYYKVQFNVFLNKYGQINQCTANN